ncbi:OmpA family protein [Sphingomonas sp. MAH-20]|uniref:OmpA family protein n=1 Tax=Sphingomonas horti TaxID=2682842 RepID=A0A6I4J2P1_9SPHN|nr:MULTISPECIES: flagellar motor protein MotB [Sphingomonas]MBA2918857.1 OmpA family protein [Sphingomonas sp. CGMCC 1.13658]MVO78890.1 OmpA family protein [Sphingomonas horti]
MAKRITVPARAGSNEPPKIIVKKIVGDDHGGHHGGAWKVAYADFVTAMMAFFLLMWLLGATTEKQRKSIADYFSPTLVETKRESAGSNGLLGGSSLMDKDAYPFKAAQTGTRALTVPLDATGGAKEGQGNKLRNEDVENFKRLSHRLQSQLGADPRFRKIASHVRFTPTREGLRIDLIDDADYSMFALGTTALNPEAADLIDTVAKGISSMPNQVSIRGHTDSLGYGDPRSMNNWMLSSGRAEATRRRLAMGSVLERRFERIEGVADRDPYIEKNPADPRNRRVSITLLYRGVHQQ